MKRRVVVPAAMAVMVVNGSGWSTLAVNGSPSPGCAGTNSPGIATWSGNAIPVKPIRSAAHADLDVLQHVGLEDQGQPELHGPPGPFGQLAGLSVVR